MLTFTTQMAFLSIFALEFEKAIFTSEIKSDVPQIFLKGKFPAKIKILKFRTKNTLLGKFWGGI